MGNKSIKSSGPTFCFVSDRAHQSFFPLCTQRVPASIPFLIFFFLATQCERAPQAPSSSPGQVRNFTICLEKSQILEIKSYALRNARHQGTVPDLPAPSTECSGPASCEPTVQLPPSDPGTADLVIHSGSGYYWNLCMVLWHNLGI